MTRDHIVPRSQGGKIVVPCCKACNHVKADLSIEEWDFWRVHNPEWWKLYPRFTARTYFKGPA